MTLKDKMNRALEVLTFASFLSSYYYGEPLAVVDDGGLLTDFVKSRLAEDEYEIVPKKIDGRICVFARPVYDTPRLDDFGLMGVSLNAYFSLERAREVHRESVEVNDELLDCNFIRNMKEHGNTAVYPLRNLDERELKVLSIPHRTEV